MQYQKNGDTFAENGKALAVGDLVFANRYSIYTGLFGTVTEIRVGENPEDSEICCKLQMPESDKLIQEMERQLSLLRGCPQKITEPDMDHVIMAPEMLVKVSEDLPGNAMDIFSLTCQQSSGETCSAWTLAVSNDIGVLLGRMLQDLDTYEVKTVLSHVEPLMEAYRFEYGEETGDGDLQLVYTVSEVPVLTNK